MKLTTRHIPAGTINGLQGVALCGRVARYRRDDAEAIRRAYLDPRNREGACKLCVARFVAQMRP